MAHIFSQVFESGSLYSPSVLDIKEDDLLARVKTGLANITAVSLATGYPTEVRANPLFYCTVDFNCTSLPLCISQRMQDCLLALHNRLQSVLRPALWPPWRAPS